MLLSIRRTPPLARIGQVRLPVWKFGVCECGFLLFKSNREGEVKRAPPFEKAEGEGGSITHAVPPPQKGSKNQQNSLPRLFFFLFVCFVSKLVWCTMKRSNNKKKPAAMGKPGGFPCPTHTHRKGTSFQTQKGQYSAWEKGVGWEAGKPNK